MPKSVTRVGLSWERGGEFARRLGSAARRVASSAHSHAAKGFAATALLQRSAANLVFPPACASCYAELEADEPRIADLPFCRACFDELDLLSGPTCRRCGGPLPLSARSHEQRSSDAPSGCFRCRERRGRRIWFDETVAAGMYEGLLRELVLKMKRAEADALSLAMGHLVWRQCGERMASLKPDVVVPIPLHWRRRLEHRTNSAAVLAEVLSDRLEAPLGERLLRRRRHTPRQSELTPPQRWENLRQAFSVRAGYHLREAHVLLVDDILTTGATCSEAARTLRRAGAQRVSVAVVARAIG